jgi:serine/threonine protein kinase
MLEPDALLQNRYKIIRPIGKGGMGAVYLAIDQRLGHTIALKESFFAEDYMRKAFEREARLLAGLRHTALPRVSDHFTEGEGQFLVMEFIPGDDMAELLARRGQAFSTAEVLGWADQLLDALDYLHTQEPPIIHRDIKPQNLKLTGRNQIILLDFGLAKGAAAGMTRVSSMGSVFGYTATYASLEQIQGAGTDPRSDLYSLGATLYHLLTNAAPVDAVTRATASVNGDPDPLCPAHELNRALTPQISAVLAKALALKRNDRPASAEELRRMLREAGQAPMPVGSQQRQGDPLAATLKMTPEMFEALKTDPGKGGQTGAAVSEVTAQPPPNTTAPENKTAPPGQQTAPAQQQTVPPQRTVPPPQTVPPVVNTLPPAQTTQPAARPPKPRRTGRTVAWVVAGLGLVMIIGLISFAALAYYVSTQQQTTDDSSTNTRPVENSNRSEANLNSNSAENSNRNSAANSNSNNMNDEESKKWQEYINGVDKPANRNTDSSEQYVANPSDVHIDALYMADSPDGTATTSFSPTDHTVYAIVKLNKIAGGTQVRFTWIAVDVAGEQQGSKIRDVDYTMGAMENIVKAHLTLPQDWPTGQYKVEVYLNGNLEQTIEYTVE